MFSRVTANTELRNPELRLRGEIQGEAPDGLLQAHLLVTRSTHNLVLCVFLLKDGLFNILLLIYYIDFTANGTVAHA